MNWNGPADFLAMGGYGLYVWGAYAMTAAYMVFDAVSARRRHRRALHDGDGDADHDEAEADAIAERREVTA